LPLKRAIILTKGNMEWYHQSATQKFGPMTLETLSQAVRDGHVRKEDVVWHEGMSDWAPAGMVPELLPHFSQVRASVDLNTTAMRAIMPVHTSIWAILAGYYPVNGIVVEGNRVSNASLPAGNGTSVAIQIGSGVSAALDCLVVN